MKTYEILRIPWTSPDDMAEVINTNVAVQPYGNARVVAVTSTRDELVVVVESEVR